MSLLRAVAVMLVIAGLAMGNACAQSQPLETPQNTGIAKANPSSSDGKNKESEGNKANPGKLVLPVKESETKKLDTITNNLDKDKEEELKIERQTANADDKTANQTERLANITATLAHYTSILACVAVFQLLMFGFQLWFTRESFKDTKDVANATKANAQFVINAERPHLIIESIEINIPEQVTSGFPITPIVSYKFTNYGKSPAWIIEAATCFEKLHGLPLRPDYGKLDKLSGAAIPPGKSITPFRILGVSISEKEWAEITQERKLRLFVYGFIRYKDVFEIPHITRFAYQWNPGGGIYKSYIEEVSNSSYWEYT